MYPYFQRYEGTTLSQKKEKKQVTLRLWAAADCSYRKGLFGNGFVPEQSFFRDIILQMAVKKNPENGVYASFSGM